MCNTYMHIYIYIYVCVCLRVYTYTSKQVDLGILFIHVSHALSIRAGHDAAEDEPGEEGLPRTGPASFPTRVTCAVGCDAGRAAQEKEEGIPGWTVVQLLHGVLQVQL